MSKPKPIVFLFSGQGSQYYHMGSYLYEQDPIFKQWLDKANYYILYKYNINILEKLYDPCKGKDELFDNILYTHPAIFIVEFALAQLIMQRGVFPDYVMGTSLGEFTASVLGGCFSFYEALDAIVNQAFLIDKKFPAGRMIAVFDDYRKFDKEPELFGNSEIASINFHKHYLISCCESSYASLISYFKKTETPFQSIMVQNPFHCSLLDSMKGIFKKNAILEPSQKRFAAIPIISCTDSQIHRMVNLDYFWDVIRQPILFYQTARKIVNYLDNGAVYLDLGPSGTLATFLKYSLNNSSLYNVFHIMSPFGEEEKHLKGFLDFAGGVNNL